MATDIFTIVANGTTYDGNKISNLYYKDAHNQVGRFEFDGFKFDATDLSNFTVNTIIIIYLNGVNRFEGFVQKVKHDKNRDTYHVEGQSLSGIFGTKVTDVPVIIRMTNEDYTRTTTKNILANIIFSRCRFKSSGDTGVSIVGGDGVFLFFYKIEQRTGLDHLANLAKISGYDWRVYLGPVE